MGVRRVKFLSFFILHSAGTKAALQPSAETFGGNAHNAVNRRLDGIASAGCQACCSTGNCDKAFNNMASGRCCVRNSTKEEWDACCPSWASCVSPSVKHPIGGCFSEASAPSAETANQASGEQSSGRWTNAPSRVYVYEDDHGYVPELGLNHSSESSFNHLGYTESSWSTGLSEVSSWLPPPSVLVFAAIVAFGVLLFAIHLRRRSERQFQHMNVPVNTVQGHPVQANNVVQGVVVDGLE